MNTSQIWQQCNSQTFWKEEAATSHVVQIYENDTEFLNLLESFASGGLMNGDAVVLIATTDHLTAIEKRLTKAGFDVPALTAQEVYQPLDAVKTLSQFMVNNWPDYSLFMQTISEVFIKARKENRHVRAFGEMVAVLWEQGNGAATLMLEQLWNMQAEQEPFSLFCAYPKSAFPLDSDVSLRNICKHHAKVISGIQDSKTELAFYNLSQ